MNHELTAISLRGVAFETVPLVALADELARRAMDDSPPAPVRLVNTNSLASAGASAEYNELLHGPGINVPDGTPLRWLLSLLGRRRVPPMRGPDLFRMTLARGQKVGLRHFLLGGTPESLKLLESQVRSNYPHCKIVGSSSPPFRTLTDNERSEQDAAIRVSNPHIVWVGLGGARQDHEAARISTSLHVTAIGVGAAFDFVSGVKPEAPIWLRGSGLEWLHRLSTEPRRLLSRYTVQAISGLKWLASG